MSQTPPSQSPAQPAVSPEIEKMKEIVAEAAREIFFRGLCNPGEGNVSMRIGKTDELLITPSYNQYAKCTAADIVHMKFDGTKLSQGRPASTEYKLHVAIYNDRKKAKCVIHTHSPHATMLSVLRKSIPVLMEEQVAFLGGAIECAEFGQAHTEQLPQNALKALGINNAVIMANHGAMVCGADMEYTVNIATLLEKMARIYLGCLEVGEPNIVPEDKLQKFHEYFEARATYSRKKKEGTE